MLEYKGYKIDGSSNPMYMSGCESLESCLSRRPSWLDLRGHAHGGQDIQHDQKPRLTAWSWRSSGWIILRNGLFLLSCCVVAGYF